jgi:hypothetical protein
MSGAGSPLVVLKRGAGHTLLWARALDEGLGLGSKRHRLRVGFQIVYLSAAVVAPGQGPTHTIPAHRGGEREGLGALSVELPCCSRSLWYALANQAAQKTEVA